jgi:hypothetical protein
MHTQTVTDAPTIPPPTKKGKAQPATTEVNALKNTEYKEKIRAAEATAFEMWNEARKSGKDAIFKQAQAVFTVYTAYMGTSINVGVAPDLMHFLRKKLRISSPTASKYILIAQRETFLRTLDIPESWTIYYKVASKIEEPEHQKAFKKALSKSDVLVCEMTGSDIDELIAIATGKPQGGNTSLKAAGHTADGIRILVEQPKGAVTEPGEEGDEDEDDEETATAPPLDNAVTVLSAVQGEDGEAPSDTLDDDDNILDVELVKIGLKRLAVERAFRNALLDLGLKHVRVTVKVEQLSEVEQLS